MSAKSLARKIKQARTEKNLKQAELAKLVGVSTQLISAFESARITPAKEYIEKIAHFTGKPVFFFTGQRTAEALARIDEMIVELHSIREILAEAIEGEGEELK